MTVCAELKESIQRKQSGKKQLLAWKKQGGLPSELLGLDTGQGVDALLDIVQPKKKITEGESELSDVENAITSKEESVNEDAVNAYQTDMFYTNNDEKDKSLNSTSGTALAARVRSSGQESNVPAKAAILRGRSSALRGEYGTVTELRKGERYKVSSTTIDTHEAAADMFNALLGDRAREALDVVVLDTDYKAIALQRMSTGTLGGSNVYPEDIIRFVSSFPDAKYFYAGHNHPSGKANFSPDDHSITRQISLYADKLDVKFSGMFAIGEGEYAFMPKADEDYIYSLPRTKKTKVVNLLEQKIIKRGWLSDEKITSPKTAKEIVYSVSSGREGIVLMDTQHGVTAFYPLAFPEIDSFVASKKEATGVLASVARSNAAAAILVSDRLALREAENLSALLDKVGIKTLDYFADGISHIESNLFTARKQDRLFSKGGVSPTGSTVDQVRKELSKRFGNRINLLEKQGKLLLKEKSNDNSAGSYADGKVTLYANNIEQGQAFGVLLHEAGEHAGLESMVGKAKYQQIIKQFDTLLSKNNAYAKRAVDRVPDDTQAEHVNSERLAYLIEEVTNNPKREGFGAARLLMNRVIAAVKAWAFDKLPSWATRGLKLSPDDFKALAVRAARAYADKPATMSTLNDKSKKKTVARNDEAVVLPDAIIGHTLGELNEHPDYEAAKSGDVEAAINVARDLVTDEIVSRVKSQVSSDTVIVPVLAQERQGKNKIPLTVAVALAKKTGLSIDSEIFQTNKVGRTQLDGLDRLFAIPEFDGGDIAGKKLLLVDDTLTQGGTFSALASHINQTGGRVEGVFALTGKRYSAKLSPDRAVLDRLVSRFGDIEDAFRQATGYGFSSLTQSEARYLANYKPAHRVRAKILEKGYEAGNHSSKRSIRSVDKSKRTTHDEAPPSEGLRRSGESNIRYSKKAPPSEGLVASGDNEKLSKKATDFLEKLKIKEVYNPVTGEYSLEKNSAKDVLKWLKDRYININKGLGDKALHAMSLHGIVKRYGYIFKKFSHDPIKEIERYSLVGMQSVMTHWADKFQKASDAYIGLKRHEQKRVDQAMLDATIYEVHPDAAFEQGLDLTWARGKVKSLQGELAAINKDQNRWQKNRAMSEEEATLETAKIKTRIKGLKRSIDHEQIRRREYKGVAERYAKMSQAEKDVYQSFKFEMEKMWQKQTDALEAKISEIRGLSDSDVREAKNTLTELREERRKKLKLGPYFPLRRYGKYMVLVTFEDGEYMRMHYDSFSEMKEVEANIKRDYPNAKVSSLTKNEDPTKAISDITGTASKLLGVAGSVGEVDPQLKGIINQFIIQNLPEVSARKSELRRYFVKGASGDMHRGFANTILHGAHDLSRIMYSHKIQQELDHIDEQITLHEDLAKGKYNDEPLKKKAAEESLMIDEKDIHKATEVLAIMRKQVDGIMNPNTSTLAAASGNFAFQWFLGLSPAAAIVNMSQVPQIAFPMLGAKYGFKKAASEFKKAYKDVSGSLKKPKDMTVRDSIFMTEDADHIPEDEQIMLKVMQMEGTTDATQANTLASVSSGDGRREIGTMSLKMDKAMAWSGVFFHNAEILNRHVVQLAAYRLAKQKMIADGVNWKDRAGELFEAARNATTETQYNYGHTNRSLLLKSNLAKTLFPLKNYGFLTMELLLTNWVDMVGGEKDKDTRILAARTLGGIMGMTTIMGGTAALPLSLVYFALNSLLDDEDEPWDAESAWKQWTQDVLGETGGRIATRGVVESLPVVGFDFSSRMSLANLIVNDPDVTAQGADYVSSVVNDLLGVNVAVIRNAADALFDDDTQGWRAFEKATPTFLRNISKAGRYYAEGATSRKGDVVVADISGIDAIKQAAGFGVGDVGYAYSERNKLRVIQKKLDAREKLLRNRYARAVMDGIGDPHEAWREIMEFNSKNPHIAITKKKLDESVKRRQKNRLKKAKLHGLWMTERYQRQLEDYGYRVN